MEYKLNSFKTFKDNWILVICGMIIALFAMLLISTWWVDAKVIEEVEEIDVVENEIENEIEDEIENEEENNREWQPWDLNDAKDAQEMPVLIETESHKRFVELCEKYNLPADVIWHTENYYGLKEGTILCIAITETSGWTKWWGRPWCWNYGNVGNTDNPNNRRCFPNQWAWLAAIGQTLNNNNLKNNQTIACLHWAWNCIEPNASWKRYATSPSGNWWRNMVWCFYSIYQEKINQSTFNLHKR